MLSALKLTLKLIILKLNILKPSTLELSTIKPSVIDIYTSALTSTIVPMSSRASSPIPAEALMTSAEPSSRPHDQSCPTLHQSLFEWEGRLLKKHGRIVDRELELGLEEKQLLQDWAEFRRRRIAFAQKEELAKKRHDDLDEEAVRLDKKAARLEEEANRLGERVTRQDEEAARLDKKAARLEEEANRVVERATRQDEEAARLDKKAARLEEEANRVVERATRQDGEAKRLEEKATRQDKEATRLGKEASRLDGEARKLSEREAELNRAEDRSQARIGAGRVVCGTLWLSILVVAATILATHAGDTPWQCSTYQGLVAWGMATYIIGVVLLEAVRSTIRWISTREWVWGG